MLPATEPGATSLWPARLPPADRGWGVLTQVTLPGGGKVSMYEPRHARPAAAGTRRKPARAASKAASKPAKKSAKKAAAKPAKKSAKKAARKKPAARRKSPRKAVKKK